MFCVADASRTSGLARRGAARAKMTQRRHGTASKSAQIEPTGAIALSAP
jgi:hypothetical protein